jgi:hypothetical protein
MENVVVKRGKKGKSQGIEASANADDVWVWMRPHIGFCTIGKCDMLSFFLLIESLPAACKSHHLFLETWTFSNEVSLLLVFNPYSPHFFFKDPSFAGERFHSMEFSRRITW